MFSSKISFFKSIYLFVVLLCFANVQLFSQPNVMYKKLRDSLQTLPSYDTVSFFKIINRLKQISEQLQSPQKKADVLQIIGTYYYFRTEVSNAKLYYDSALTLLKKYPDRALKNIIELKQGYIMLDNVEFNKAKAFYRLKQRSEKNDTMAQILINMALGQIYQAEQKHDSSLIYFYNSVKFAIQKNDLYYIATSKNNLGGEYRILSRNNEAKKEFAEAVVIAKKTNNKKLAASINSNMASVYVNENKINEALQIYNQNLKFYAGTNFYYEIAYMYLNISICNDKLKQIDNMKESGLKAIAIITKSNLPIEIINVYSQITSIFSSNKLYNEAILLSKECILFSERKNVPITDSYFYRHLSNAYEAVGDNYNALQMNKKYISHKDSIDKKSNDKLVNELIYTHQLTEKEQKIIAQQAENKLLKKENELYNLSKKYYLIIIFFIIASCVLLSFYLIERRVKKQKEIYAGQLINEIDNDRERIAMDLHDDLGLGITIARQKLLNAQLNDEVAKKDVEENLMNLLEKTRKIARDLFPSTLKHLRFEEFISNLLDSIEKQNDIICSYEIDTSINKYDINTKTHILRILQECIHNSIKYSGANAIRIQVMKVTQDKLQITYYDNGFGFKDSKKERGLGLKNIYQRAVLINADINIGNNDSNKGIKLSLTLNNYA